MAARVHPIGCPLRLTRSPSTHKEPHKGIHIEWRKCPRWSPKSIGGGTPFLQTRASIGAPPSAVPGGWSSPWPGPVCHCDTQRQQECKNEALFIASHIRLDPTVRIISYEDPTAGICLDTQSDGPHCKCPEKGRYLPGLGQWDTHSDGLYICQPNI